MLLYVCIYLISINIVTMITYGVDKYSAKKGKSRISEKKLHLLSLVGGSPFAFLAQKIFHHKTKKKIFRRVFYLIILFQIIVIIIYLKIAKPLYIYI